MSNHIKIGTKFYNYIKDSSNEPKLNIIRITKCVDNEVEFVDSNKKKFKTSYDYIADNYRAITPDGFIVASIVKVKDLSDVIFALSPITEQEIPYAVCRQGISDVFTNNMAKSDFVLYLGASISQDTCPSNIDFRFTLSCDKVIYTLPIVVYLDDTLDDILGLFKHKKFDTAIRNYSAAMEHNVHYKRVLGTCNTIKELLINNNFMFDFRKCFNIVEIPHPVDLEYESLSPENVEFLNSYLDVNISETYVIEYSKEIDLSSIRRNYVLAASAAEEFKKIYIIGYDVYK